MTRTSRLILALSLLLASARWCAGQTVAPTTQPVSIKAMQFGCWLQRPDQLAVWQRRGLNLSIISTPQPTTLTDVQYGQACASLNMALLKLPNWANPTADFSVQAFAGWSYSDEPENWNHNGLHFPQAIANDQKTIDAMHGYWAKQYGSLPCVDYRNFNGPTLASMGNWERSAQHPVIIADYQAMLPQQSIVSADAYPIATGVGGIVQLALIQQRLILWGAPNQRRFGYVECGYWGQAGGRLILPEEFRAEFWLNIIYGDTGIIVFEAPSISGPDTMTGTPLEASLMKCVATAKLDGPYFISGAKSPLVINGTVYSETWKLGGSTLSISQNIAAPFTTTIVETTP